MRQVIFDFGILEIFGKEVPLRIFGYGLMIVGGFLAGILLARWRARRVGENPDVLANCGILSLVGGIFGSRLAYVIENWDSFTQMSSPLGAVLNITSGGLIYYGGVILAIVMVVGYLRAKRLPIRRHLDILAVSLMVGLAFGRVGCLLNGCCFGSMCRQEWTLGMRFPMYSKPLVKFDGRDNPFSWGTDVPSPVYAHQLEIGDIRPDPALVDSSGQLILPRNFTAEQIAIADASRSLPVQPAQALGIVNALLIGGILMGFYKLRKREGQVFALMLILYPLTRFVLESIRDTGLHDLSRGVLTHNQWTSLATCAVGAIMWWFLRFLPASAGPTWAWRLKELKRSENLARARHKPA